MADGDSEHEDPGVPRRRKRNLLKMFYGAANPETEASPQGNPLDINNSAFDCEQYLEKLYGELPLPEIVTKEKRLNSQIKTLDSEMQTLVYENYNKFISATDTIRKMKSQVDGMEEEMTRLGEKMKNISDLSNGIESTLSERRDRICSLANSHSLLRNLQFLFELPARLNQCIKMESYLEAVTYYTRAAHVLDRYKEHESFKSINDECATLMANLREMIEVKLAESGTTQNDVLDYFDMLCKLRVPPDEICPRVLEFAKKQNEKDRVFQEDYYKENLKRFEENPNGFGLTLEDISKEESSEIAEEDGDDDKDEDQDKAVKPGFFDTNEISKEFAQDIGDPEVGGEENTTLEPTNPSERNSPDPEFDETQMPTGEDDQETLTNPEAPRTGNTTPRPLHPLISFLRQGHRVVLCNLVEWIIGYQEIFCKAGNENEDTHTNSPEKLRLQKVSATATEILNSTITDLSKSYLARIEELFTEFIESDGDLRVLSMALSELVSGSTPLENLLQPTDLGFSELAVATIRQLCRQQAEKLQNGLSGQIEKLSGELRTFSNADDGRLLREATSLGSWIKQECSAALDKLSVILESEISNKHSFFEGEFQNRCIRNGVVQAFLKYIIEQARGYVGTPVGPTSARPVRSDAAPVRHGPPAVIIIMAHLCRNFGDVVQELIKETAKRFTVKDARVASDSAELDEMTLEQKRRQGSELAAGLVARFIEDESFAIFKTIEEDLLGNVILINSNPKSVSKGIVIAVREIHLAFTMAGDLFEEDHTSPAKKGKYHIIGNGITSMAPSSALMSNLFSDNIEVFEKTVSERDKMMFAIVKIIVKGYSEAVRVCRFNQHSFQQIQLDINFLGEQVWRYAAAEEEERFLHSILSKVLAGAASRCTSTESESLQMEVDKIQELCEQAKQDLNMEE
eukprot:m.131752 g.131752  ORF g.131752 m.131752 type:complete len:914 (+) comp14635_c0_seq1:167-2908(+)